MEVYGCQSYSVSLKCIEHSTSNHFETIWKNKNFRYFSRYLLFDTKFWILMFPFFLAKNFFSWKNIEICAQDHKNVKYNRFQIILWRFRKIDFLWFLVSGRYLGNRFALINSLIKSLTTQILMKKWSQSALIFLKSFQKYIVDS